MNITLTSIYVQRIEKRLVMLYYISIQIPCLPSDDSMTLKMGDAFQSDCKVCVSHIRYLFISSEAARANYVTLLTHYVITMTSCLTTQLKQTITIEMLHLR